jgi:hypothetical protein
VGSEVAEVIEKVNSGHTIEAFNSLFPSANLETVNDKITIRLATSKKIVYNFCGVLTNSIGYLTLLAETQDYSPQDAVITDSYVPRETSEEFFLYILLADTYRR